MTKQPDVIPFPHSTSYYRCTRTHVQVRESFSIWDLVGEADTVMASLISATEELIDAQFEEDYTWGESSATGIELTGYRLPTDEEQAAIDKAWAAEDARRVKQKEKDKAAAKKLLAQAAEKERKEFERLKKKYDK